MVSCLKCKHYFNTYDPQMPRGCRLFKLKSKSFPSELVKAESGDDCEGYELSGAVAKKEAEAKSKKGFDDDDLW